MQYECDEPSLFTSINKNTNKIFQLQLSIKEQHLTFKMDIGIENFNNRMSNVWHMTWHTKSKNI